MGIPSKRGKVFLQAQFIFLLVQPLTAMGLTSDEYMKLLCKYTPAIQAQGGVNYLANVATPDPLYKCIANLGYAVPNKYFDGKQWHINRKQKVSINEAAKSIVTYYKLPLAKEQKGQDVYYLTMRLYGIKPPKDKDLREESLFRDIIRQAEKAAARIPANKRQTYFPDGPVSNGTAFNSSIASFSRFHQKTSLLGSIENNSEKVNGIGIWGDASSNTEDAKVWGGFFTVRNTPQRDAQLSGAEIDVLNYAKSGTYGNKSKVGLQLVSIGDYDSSTALEVLSDHKSRWRNGILFQDGSISPYGTAIAIASINPVMYGIDASRQSFTDAAFLLGKDSKIKWKGMPGKDVVITADDYEGGNFVVRANGLRVVTTDDSVNILKVTSKGDIDGFTTIQALCRNSLDAFINLNCVISNLYRKHPDSKKLLEKERRHHS